MIPLQSLKASFVPKKLDTNKDYAFLFMVWVLSIINNNIYIEVKMGSLTAIYFFVFLVCVGIIAFIMALEKIRKKDEEDL